MNIQTMEGLDIELGTKMIKIITENIALVRVAEIMIQENLRGIVFPFYVYGKEGCELLKLNITIKEEEKTYVNKFREKQV